MPEMQGAASPLSGEGGLFMGRLPSVVEIREALAEAVERDSSCNVSVIEDVIRKYAFAKKLRKVSLGLLVDTTKAAQQSLQRTNPNDPKIALYGLLSTKLGDLVVLRGDELMLETVARSA